MSYIHQREKKSKKYVKKCARGKGKHFCKLRLLDSIRKVVKVLVTTFLKWFHSKKKNFTWNLSKIKKSFGISLQHAHVLHMQIRTTLVTIKLVTYDMKVILNSFCLNSQTYGFIHTRFKVRPYTTKYCSVAFI